MLRDIESKLAGLVEGTFGRLFRSEVTPAELARGLSREMESTRRQGVDRTWVAHRYDVYLSPSDYRRITEAGAPLTDELSNSLLLHAREQRFALAHAPEVRFHRENKLATSRYGVRATHDDAPSPAATTPDPARSPVAQRPPAAAAPARPREQVAARRAEPAASSSLVLVFEGRREPVPAGGGTIGRSRECDVVIASAEVSREHAQLRPTASGWEIVDLGSTNGVRVNGVEAGGVAAPAAVRPGDRINLGTVVLQVEAAS